MTNKHLQPLDIVATPSNSIAIVTEVHDNGDCSINFIHFNPDSDDYTAWWSHGELRLLDSLPSILAEAMAHPFSGAATNPYHIKKR